MVFSDILKREHGANDEFDPTIRFSFDKSVNPDNVQELCSTVGWSRRDPHLIGKALRNSLVVVTAWKGSLLVGFARATGDKVFNATIWDVVVRPGFQRRGIGYRLMQELLKEIDTYEIPLVTLYADPGRDKFYKRFGFTSDPFGVRGMFREKSYE